MCHKGFFKALHAHKNFDVFHLFIQMFLFFVASLIYFSWLHKSGLFYIGNDNDSVIIHSVSFKKKKKR